MSSTISMLYMFIITTIWIEIFICSIHKFFYNIIVTIFTLRINSNPNTYFKFSCHNYSPPSSITPIGLMSFTLSSSVKKETFIVSLT